MKVLFSLRNFWYVKIFESAVLELATRGHQVMLVADERASPDGSDEWQAAAERLTDASPLIRWRYFEREETGQWAAFTRQLRFGGDYLRFLDPVYTGAPMLRARAASRTPEFARSLAGSWPFRIPRGRQLLRRALVATERAVPDDQAVVALLETERPDVVMVSPLISLGSPQFDILRTAMRRGIRSALAVGSWDHLSSKALVRDIPDLVLVWNDTQRDEAVRLHGIPAEQIAVTGAQCFDQWFDRQPTRNAETFKRHVGLAPDKPFVLWVCSALFEGSPSEAALVARWAALVRHHPLLAEYGVLVRPHPKRGHQWTGSGLGAVANSALWPKNAAAPFDPDTKDDYFDSLFHASAVVGLNTSALLEAAVAGRPVLTVLLPEFHDNQGGTLHFRYLLEVAGGLLGTSRTLDEQVDQLASAVVTPDAAIARSRRFVEAFLRPHGLSTPATEKFADAVETLSRTPVTRPIGDPWWVSPLRVAIAPVARRTRGTESIERQRRQHLKREERDAEVARRVADKQRRYAEELLAREQRVAREHADNEMRRAARIKARDDHSVGKQQAKQVAKRRKARQQFVQRVRARLAALIDGGRPHSR
ncbi:MAG TPA: hypothetical protein VNJ02_04960 [Vicinamibacterales bacterium]|nr:hypothetical protein [Vicinamibacterales bacterium]